MQFSIALHDSGSAASRASIFFFFEAEDGIRDWSVTRVQTCALPIYRDLAADHLGVNLGPLHVADVGGDEDGVLQLEAFEPLAEDRAGVQVVHRNIKEPLHLGRVRSEERRVGKECICRSWSAACSEEV